MRVIGSTCFILLILPIVTHAQNGLDRLLQGEILYESLQGDDLDALLRIHAYRASTDRLNASNKPSAADSQLALGLRGTVANNIKTRSSDVRIQQSNNRDAFQLAWFYYHERKPAQALEVLDSIEGKADNVSLSDIEYLRALLYIHTGRFKAAATLLYELPLIDRPRGYTRYNLALAQLQSGNEERGRSTLESLGRIYTGDSELLALKDLANLKLAYRYLQQGSLEQASASFDLVRLDGPFTDQALLGSGWSLFSMNQIERAIVAWSLLHKQEAINDSVIEAKMALPYAYSKLGVHGKAANLYAHAVELFESEIARLDASAGVIRRGDLGRAIVNNHTSQGDDWITRLSRRTEQAEFYLPLLLANDEFRDQADELSRLAQLKIRVEQGLTSVAAMSEFAELKRKHHDTTLPAAEKELSAIDQDMKKIIPPVPQQTDTPNTRENMIPEIARLQHTYNRVVDVHKAAAEYNRQLPAYRHQLAGLATALKRLDQQLGQAIASTGKQVEAIALTMLERKRNQLKDYHHKALFALAESYDFATGNRQ
jgi:hypothetical protein